MARSTSKNKAIDTIYLNFSMEFNTISLLQHLCIQVGMLQFGWMDYWLGEKLDSAIELNGYWLMVVLHLEGSNK